MVVGILKLDIACAQTRMECIKTILISTPRRSRVNHIANLFDGYYEPWCIVNSCGDHGLGIFHFYKLHSDGDECKILEVIAVNGKNSFNRRSFLYMERLARKDNCDYIKIECYNKNLESLLIKLGYEQVDGYFYKGLNNGFIQQKDAKDRCEHYNYYYH